MGWFQIIYVYLDIICVYIYIYTYIYIYIYICIIYIYIKGVVSENRLLQVASVLQQCRLPCCFEQHLVF